MKTDFDFIAEQIETLKTRIAAELNDIIAAISTEEIPLSDIPEADIHVGYFDPVTYANTPAIFILPQSLSPDYGEGSYNDYETKTPVAIFIVNRAIGSDPAITSYQSYNYAKAFVSFINTHLDDYELGEEGIELYEALGADTSRRWVQISLIINGTIQY